LSSLLFLTLVFALAAAYLKNKSDHRPIDWESYSKGRVEELINDQKTVLISLTANWDFSSCLLEFTVLRTPEIGKFLRDYNAVALRADFTNYDGEVKKLMDEMEISFLPAIIVLSPIPAEPPIILEHSNTNSERLRQVVAHAHYAQAIHE
jgi:thiol:disulfide interchange protein